MEYYFYSTNAKLRGMMNFKMLKPDLHTDKFDALKAAECFHGVSRENPVGFIYSCRRISNISFGENLNHGYKSETPVWINGCEYITDIYEEFDMKYTVPKNEKKCEIQDFENAEKKFEK